MSKTIETIKKILASKWTRYCATAIIAAVLIAGLVSHGSKKWNEAMATIKALKSERVNINAANAALNKSVVAMQKKHATVIVDLNEKIIKAHAEVDKIKVATKAEIATLKKDITKTWQQKFTELEYEFNLCLDKNYAVTREMVLKDQLIHELKSVVSNWERVDLERQGLMNNCTIQLAESINLNENQADENKKLSRRLKFWRIVAYVAGGGLIYGLVRR